MSYQYEYFGSPREGMRRLDNTFPKDIPHSRGFGHILDKTHTQIEMFLVPQNLPLTA
jgi:hypothetical protein